MPICRDSCPIAPCSALRRCVYDRRCRVGCLRSSLRDKWAPRVRLCGNEKTFRSNLGPRSGRSPGFCGTAASRKLNHTEFRCGGGGHRGQSSVLVVHQNETLRRCSRSESVAVNVTVPAIHMAVLLFYCTLGRLDAQIILQALPAAAEK